MIEFPDIQELFRYNRWANDQALDVASRLTEEELTRDLRSSYPSVRDTLTHILWAEWIWLQRWKGHSPRHVFAATEFPTLDALKARWSDHHAEQSAFVDSVTSERLAAVFAYVNLRGETWRYPLWRQMYHVVNHSNYHRGQVTTMVRQLGKSAVSTDFLVFHDELESTEPSHG